MATISLSAYVCLQLRAGFYANDLQLSSRATLNFPGQIILTRRMRRKKKGKVSQRIITKRNSDVI